MEVATTVPDSVAQGGAHRPPLAILVVGTLGAALLIAAPANVVVTVIGGAILLSLCLVYPTVGLCLMPFAVAFGSLASVSLHGVSVGPTDALVAGLCLSWLIRHFERLRTAAAQPRKFALEIRLRLASSLARDGLRSAAFGALLSYLAVICLSLLVATDKTSTLKELIKWTEVSVMLALGLWLLRTPQHMRALLWCAIAAAAVEASLGLAQWALPSGVADSLRVYGTFAQPNPYAGYLNLALPLAAAIALFGSDVRERWIAAGASTLLLVALLFSTSRGGLLGLVGAVVTLALADVRKPRFVATALAGAIALAVIAWLTDLIPASLQQRVLHSFRLDDLSVTGPVTSQNFSTMERFAHWVAGLRMFAAHPILGVGAGNYDAAYARYVVDLSTWPESLGHAHNYYINAAAETGILGLLAFSAFTVCVLVASWRLVRAVSSSARHDASTATVQPLATRALAVGLFAIFVAFIVHNATDDLFVHAMELQFALYVACVFAQRPRLAHVT